MFEGFDDPAAPDIRPIDAVVERGDQLRRHRRAAIAAMGAGAASFLAVVFVVVLSVNASGGAHRKLLVQEPTTVTPSTVASQTTTVAESTSTTLAPVTTTTAAPIVTPVTFPPATTTTAPHDPHDYSGLAFHFGSAAVNVTTGWTISVTYTVTNNAPWTVEWTEPDCPYHVWGNQDYIWPDWTVVQGYTCSAIRTITVPGNASVSRTVQIAAGYDNGHGAFIPARPGGGDVFYPPPLTKHGGVCTAPCLNVYVLFATPSQYVANYPANTTVKIGSHTLVSFSIVNRVKATATVSFPGPCTWVQGSAATCTPNGKVFSAPDGIFSSTLVLPPNSTVTAHADIYATSDLQAPSAVNSPVSAGTYNISWGNQTVKLTVTP
jgi:hypothetical protein